MLYNVQDTCIAHVVNLYQQHWTCTNKIEVSKSISVSVLPVVRFLWSPGSRERLKDSLPSPDMVNLHRVQRKKNYISLAQVRALRVPF